MTEEKKEVKQDAQQQETAKAESTKQEAPKAETAKQESPKQEAVNPVRKNGTLEPALSNGVKAEEPAKPQDAKKEEEKKAPVRAANCAVCNKSIRKKRYYYRNGKYFCTKRCWKTTVKKENKEAASNTAKA